MNRKVVYLIFLLSIFGIVPAQGMYYGRWFRSLCRPIEITLGVIRRTCRAKKELRIIIQEDGWKTFKNRLTGIPDDRYHAWKNALQDNLDIYKRVAPKNDFLVQRGQAILDQLKKYEEPWVQLDQALKEAHRTNNPLVLKLALINYDENRALGYLRATVVDNAKRYRNALRQWRN